MLPADEAGVVVPVVERSGRDSLEAGLKKVWAQQPRCVVGRRVPPNQRRGRVAQQVLDVDHPRMVLECTYLLLVDYSYPRVYSTSHVNCGLPR